MIGGISQITKRIGKSAALSMQKGVSMTVASATLIASAAGVMSVTDASKLVDEHSRSTNKEANLAAEILKIDRSDLVNKNYLKLATRIDDYLTGKTDKLVVDPTMSAEPRLSSQEQKSAELENIELAQKAQEALAKLTSMIDQSTSNDSINEELSTETEDQSSEVEATKDFSDNLAKILEESKQSQKPIEPSTKSNELEEVENVTHSPLSPDLNIVNELKSRVNESREEVLKDQKVFKNAKEIVNVQTNDFKDNSTDYKVAKTLENVATDKELSTNNIVLEKKSNDNEVPVEVTDVVNESKEEPKVESKVEETKANENEVPVEVTDTSNESKVEEPKVESKVEDTKVEESKVEESKVEDTKVEETKANENEVPVEVTDTSNESKVEEPKVESKVEDTKVEESKVEESKVEDTKVEETKANENEVAVEVTDPVSNETKVEDKRVNTAEAKSDERIEGHLTIRITRKFLNNKTIDTFQITKPTTGVRHADGTETWDSVKFTAADLDESQKVARSSVGVHQLVTPNFSATYVPKSQESIVDDTLTFAKGQPEEVESSTDPIKVSRSINLVKDDGTILQTLTQDSSSGTIKIPSEIDGFYTNVTELPYGESDVSITYHPIKRSVILAKIYQIKSIDETGKEIATEDKSVNLTGVRDNRTGEEIFNFAESESQLSKHADREGYEFDRTEIDHENSTVKHHYRSIKKAARTRVARSVENLTPTAVHESATSMLERMPTLSNRAEYSKFTSVDETYSRLLERSSIENLVFGISEGRYDYQTSDRVLSASQDAVLAAEMNSRFTDRLVERINEFRRSLGLQEVTKVATTVEMDRQFASATIFNYLANGHSNSKAGRAFEKATGLERTETMQPVHTLSTSNRGLTPEAAADSLFRTILKEANSYVSKDGGETGHLEQLIDPDQKSIYAGMFIGEHSTNDTFIGMFGKQIKSGTKSSYKISTTLHYFK